MIKITENEFNNFADYIKLNYGIFLKEEKQMLLTGRLHTVLEENGFKSFTEYFNYIIADKTGLAVSILLDKITTNHTYFMRETDHFEFFKSSVLPNLSNGIKERDLRIWCAGCSSGEEPYTLAMLIDEYFGQDKMLWDTKILATDISSKVIDEAVKGVYSNKEIETLPINWKMNYIKKLNSEDSVFIDKIKNEIIYRKFNLMEKHFPFKRKFHVIFCRNVMIYFDYDTKCNLVNKFYEQLEQGGYLFIGHSESIDRSKTKFKYLRPAVYRKE